MDLNKAQNGIVVIGDVHGRYYEYLDIISNYEYSVQVGDFGFDYDVLKDVDPKKHKIIGGNHDNYDIIQDVPHYLGDYGNCELNNVKFFFYRGANSIDKHLRTPHVNWWEKEENSIESYVEAKELYLKTKPNIVLTHCCPSFLKYDFINKEYLDQIRGNRTDWALEELYNDHQPDLWVFGHYHCTKSMKKYNTTFTCVDKLSTLEIGGTE